MTLLLIAPYDSLDTQKKEKLESGSNAEAYLFSGKDWRQTPLFVYAHWLVPGSKKKRWLQ